MPRPTRSSEPAPSSLLERKQRQARQRIVEAADELFQTQGFDNVSVSNITDRAEVGRTTFFRYFGDKTEVVFAKEQAMLDAVARAEISAASPAATTSAEALEQLRPLVVDFCRMAVEDAEGYRRHNQLIEQHQELRARDALKTQQTARDLAALLQRHGTRGDVAALASEIAMACYRTARSAAVDPRHLPAMTEGAFQRALTIGRSRSDS